MANLKLRPLGDRVWLEPIEREETTASGIILPETAKEKPQEGKVLAVGPGARNDKGERQPLDVKVGDRVHEVQRYLAARFGANRLRRAILTQPDAPIPEWRVGWMDGDES